ncbi:MAG: hypothetical protein IJS89_00740 [Bacteroidaceae bacterium]|nr:hypothetical protein [Bacteroidaceae bacterium]
MTHYIYNIYARVAMCLALFLSTSLTLHAQTENTGDVDDAESAAMAKTKENAPTLQETDPTGANYFGERRALVGRHCSVNRVINVVAVGTGTSGLENLTNEDIDDYATFPQVVSATVAVSPTVSVRDMKNYYAGGTTAGFCIVAGSGSSVLSLDLIKTYHIWFYCDGKRVSDQTVREANSGSGVKLSLIGIPGSAQACANLTAVCPVKFDEVAPVQGGAVDASVGSVVMIKYAFVGDAHDVHLTKIGIDEYATATGHEAMDVSCDAFMPSPLVGGIPIPMANVSEEKVIGTDSNERLDETIALVSAVQLASVAFKGRVRVNVENSNATTELFHAGDQVGFKYNFVQIADVLALGTWVDIALYDRNGNKVQTTTISAEVLELAIASGGDQTSYIVAEQDFSGAEISFYSTLGVLNLGSGYGVYYGFVRPKPTVDHECMLNPSMTTNMCSAQSTHKLKSNPEINATWELVTQPEENAGQCHVTPDGIVTGMYADGEYKFKVTAEDGCYDFVTINHGESDDFMEPLAEHPFYNLSEQAEEYELSDDLHGETSANLLSISNMTDPDNVLDGNLDNYASYTAGLQLLGSNGVILGIRKTDPAATPYIYDGSKADAMESIQIGFVVEMQRTALGLDLLNAFQIRCFDTEGNKVYQHIVEDAGLVGVGVVGTNEKSQKLRLTITVPKVDDDGNPVKFNEFQLWKIGAIDLRVSDVKFYYGFWDDPSDVRNNIIRDGAYVVNYDNMGAVVNVGTQVNVASVGGVTNNLSNIIDIDDELATYALMQKTVESGSTEIIVKLGRTVDFRHQVGVVVNNDIIGLNANVGNVLKVGTFLNGTETGETSTNWGVIGANVIQGDDKQVLYISPTSNYDEIHITAGEGLAANRTIKIYGILLRNDVDHDGVADNRDESSCNATITEVGVGRACAEGDLTFSARGTTDTKYYVSFPDQGVEMREVQSDLDGIISGNVTTTTHGQFTMYFYDGNGDMLTSAEYTVHPRQTTWRTTTSNTEWNTWNNWTNGTPYLCTDVIMPAGARVYPSLDEEVINGDEFGCAGIHFEHGAAIEKVFKLNYDKAWVDFTPTTGRYYMLAIPLKDVYTGDFFVAEAASDTLTEYNYFTDLTEANYPANRFSPRVYQRMYAFTGTHKLSTGGTTTAILLNTNWSQRFNMLNTPHPFGQVFSVYVNPEERSDELTIRLPKTHDTYYYYFESDHVNPSSFYETLTRTTPYRFSYEDDALRTIEDKSFGTFGTRNVFGNAGTMTQTATSTTPTNTFLVGNHFMSYVNVGKFLEGNPEITGIKVFSGRATASVVSINGDLISSVGNTYELWPMQSFYVTVGSERTSLDINWAEDMFTMADRGEPAPMATRPMMRIRASVHADETATDAAALLLEPQEDGALPIAETLIDADAKPDVAVFTLHGDRACDIRSLYGEREIPLGVLVGEGVDSVRLSLESLGGFDISGYRLLDRETGLTYLPDVVPTLHVSGSTIGRFVLVNTDITGIETASTDGLVIAVNGLSATISSPQHDITAVTAYTADGRIISRNATATTAQTTVSLAPGVCLIKVERAGMRSRAYTVMAH